jgi:hypothetical protein
MDAMQETLDLAAIDKSLNCLIRLLAVAVVHGRSKTEAITILSRAGLDRNFVADVVGTTPLTVSVTRSEAKRRHRSRASTRSSRKTT